MGITFIYETVVDRAHERGGDSALRAGPPVFPCEVCGRRMPSATALSEHRATEHPLEPPRLLIDGQAAIGELTVRHRLDPSQVSVVGASEILFRGPKEEQLSEAELSDRLAAATSGVFRIVLRSYRDPNGPHSDETLRLLVDVPDEADLASADDAFHNYLAVEDLQDRDLERFDLATRELQTGREYASALYDYCVSLRMLDRLDAGVHDLEDARSKAQHALDVLGAFPARPPARAVSGFIRFGLNDFRTWRDSGVPALEPCASALLRAAGLADSADELRSHQGVEGTSVCPASRSTGLLIQVWEQKRAPDFFELSRRSDFTSEDAVKAQVLGLTVTDDPSTPSAVTAAEALRHDHIFGAWAEQWLEDHGH